MQGCEDCAGMQGALMVSDEQFLNGLKRCKELGALAMVHAENGDAVAIGQEATFAAGIAAPHGHGLSRPAILEGEATGRAIRLASFVNTPLYVVHVMSIDALDEVRTRPVALRPPQSCSAAHRCLPVMWSRESMRAGVGTSHVPISVT